MLTSMTLNFWSLCCYFPCARAYHCTWSQGCIYQKSDMARSVEGVLLQPWRCSQGEQWQLCQAWALEQTGQAPLKDASFPLSRQGHSTEENVPQAVSWWKTSSVMEEDGVTMVTMCKPVRSSEASDLPASLILTWCLLTMSFNFPSSLGSISGHRKMLGRDRQLFCEEKK